MIREEDSTKMTIEIPMYHDVWMDNGKIIKFVQFMSLRKGLKRTNMFIEMRRLSKKLLNF